MAATTAPDGAVAALVTAHATGPISKRENTSISAALAIWTHDQSIVGNISLWAWIVARVKTRHARWVREFVKRAVESHFARMHADMMWSPCPFNAVVGHPWPTRAAVTDATSDIVQRTDLLHVVQALEATLLGSRIMVDYGHTGTCILPATNRQFDNEAQDVD
jgi:hypothetical protein